MKHIITLSGNSERFISKGYPHKGLLDIDGVTSSRTFSGYIEDFTEHETVFLCRNEDLPLVSDELSSLGSIEGIESNTLGPLYSLKSIHHLIDNNEPLLISYIDAPQKFAIKDLIKSFEGYEGGLTTHGLSHPHWRHNKYYCFVKHTSTFECTEVIEKYNFGNLFLEDPSFDVLGLSRDSVTKIDTSKCKGSNGTYFFSRGDLLKDYSASLMKQKKTVNGEYYVTQVYQEMISDGLKVKAHDCPYVSFGIPEDVEDYLFWKGWFK